MRALMFLLGAVLGTALMAGDAFAQRNQGCNTQPQVNRASAINNLAVQPLALTAATATGGQIVAAGSSSAACSDCAKATTTATKASPARYSSALAASFCAPPAAMLAAAPAERAMLAAPVRGRSVERTFTRVAAR